MDSRLALAAEVFDRSQGNPFFAEQLAEAGGGTGLPPVLREVLLARVGRLSPTGQQVLRVAAVAGRWVRWSAPGRRCNEFRHALLQEAVYGELLPGQRARLHGA